MDPSGLVIAEPQWELLIGTQKLFQALFVADFLIGPAPEWGWGWGVSGLNPETVKAQLKELILLHWNQSLAPPEPLNETQASR